VPSGALSGGSLASGLNLTYGTNSYTGTAIVATGNATAAQVLYPYTASNASGSLTGSFTAAPATAYVGSYGTGTVGTLTGAYSGGTAYSVTPGSTSIAYISTSGTVTTFPTWQPYTGLTSTGTNQIAGITFATTSGTANNGTFSGICTTGGSTHATGVYDGTRYFPYGCLGNNGTAATSGIVDATSKYFVYGCFTGSGSGANLGIVYYSGSPSYAASGIYDGTNYHMTTGLSTSQVLSSVASWNDGSGTMGPGTASQGYPTYIGGVLYSGSLSLAGSSSFITSGSGSLASGAALTWSGSQISYGSGTGYIGTRTIVPSAPVIPPTFQSQKFDVHKQPAKKD
jgi:hypothetical protein